MTYVISEKEFEPFLAAVVYLKKKGKIKVDRKVLIRYDGTGCVSWSIGYDQYIVEEFTKKETEIWYRIRYKMAI